MSETGSSDFDLKKYLEKWKKKVDSTLKKSMPDKGSCPPSLHEAMSYSLFAGGKRLRPILCVAACEAMNADPSPALSAGAAIEMIHTYSLIHDDLPAMDDDDMRRGKAACHKKFGEAAAILAGDALLTEAFGVLVRTPGLDPWLKNVLMAEFVAAAGASGMIAGQVADMEKEKEEFDLADVEYIHMNKTAKMIMLAVRAGALIGNGGEDDLAAMSEYGEALGRAFQITDDVLNVTGGEDLGKGVGTDSERGKATYPAAAGLEVAKTEAGRLCGQAVMALADYGYKAEPLRAIAKYVADRRN